MIRLELHSNTASIIFTSLTNLQGDLHVDTSYRIQIDRDIIRFQEILFRPLVDDQRLKLKQPWGSVNTHYAKTRGYRVIITTCQRASRADRGMSQILDPTIIFCNDLDHSMMLGLFSRYELRHQPGSCI